MENTYRQGHRYGDASGLGTAGGKVGYRKNIATSKKHHGSADKTLAQHSAVCVHQVLRLSDSISKIW